MKTFPTFALEEQTNEFFSFAPQQQQQQQNNPPADPPVDPPADPIVTPPADPATPPFVPPVVPPVVPPTVDGQTPEQIRDALARLATLEAAETQRAADAETARLQSLSEVERETARAQTAETERETARAALEAEIASANGLRLRVALDNSARELGHALHPSALDDAMRLGDFESIQFNEAREPQGVTEALKGLIARKPYLVARAEIANLGGGDGGRDDGVDEPTKARASAALLRGF